MSYPGTGGYQPGLILAVASSPFTDMERRFKEAANACEYRVFARTIRSTNLVIQDANCAGRCYAPGGASFAPI